MQLSVYILGSKSKMLNIGVTNNLARRLYEHKQGIVEGFTKRYKIHNLLYFEVYESAELAIQREKQLKHWKRDWKLDLIYRENPEFVDISEQFDF